jgi:hypothetical protein
MPEIPRGFRPTGDSHAERDDQAIAVVTARTAVGGRVYEVGERISPRFARDHQIRHVVSSDRPTPDTK